MTDNFTDKHYNNIMMNQMSRAKYHEKLANGTIVDGQWYVTNDAFKDNVGGLDVLDIGQSLYIDESQGLRRWLNGQWVDINDNTRKFYEKLMKASALNPDILCTPTEYESIISSNVFHQCGKFALDVANGKVRLPKIVYAKGGLNISNIGSITNQRILVAKKEATNTDPSWYNWYSDGWIEQGGRFGATGSDALTTVTFPKPFRDLLSDVQVNMQWTGDGGASWQYLNAKNKTTTTFQTVCQSSTYHNWRACGYTASLPTDTDVNIPFDTLQYYYIQIATGVEQVVDITNLYQLNNPYTLGESKYSPIQLNNASWLRGGVTGTRAEFPAYYDMLRSIFNGDLTIEGITVKAVGDSTIDRLDHVIDINNETFTLPTLNGTEDVQSNNANDRIDYSNQITASGVLITAKYNGWFRAYAPYEAEKHIDACNTNTDNHDIDTAGSSGRMIYTDVWAHKGDVVRLTYTTTANPNCYLRVATKPGILYFYVGDTVQNANIINAGKLVDRL